MLMCQQVSPIVFAGTAQAHSLVHSGHEGKLHQNRRSTCVQCCIMIECMESILLQQCFNATNIAQQVKKVTLGSLKIVLEMSRRNEEWKWEMLTYKSTLRIYKTVCFYPSMTIL